MILVGLQGMYPPTSSSWCRVQVHIEAFVAEGGTHNTVDRREVNDVKRGARCARTTKREAERVQAGNVVPL